MIPRILKSKSLILIGAWTRAIISEVREENLALVLSEVEISMLLIIPNIIICR